MLLFKDALYRLGRHARELVHAVDEQAILRCGCRVPLNQPEISVQLLPSALSQVGPVESNPQTPIRAQIYAVNLIPLFPYEGVKFGLIGQFPLPQRQSVLFSRLRI